MNLMTSHMTSSMSIQLTANSHSGDAHLRTETITTETLPIGPAYATLQNLHHRKSTPKVRVKTKKKSNRFWKSDFQSKGWKKNLRSWKTLESFKKLNETEWKVASIQWSSATEAKVSSEKALRRGGGTKKFLLPLSGKCFELKCAAEIWFAVRRLFFCSLSKTNWKHRTE